MLAAALLAALSLPAPARPVARPKYCDGRPQACERSSFCELDPKSPSCKKAPEPRKPDDVRRWTWPVQNYKMTRTIYGYPLLSNGDRSGEGAVALRRRLVSWDPKGAPTWRLRYSVMTLDGGEHEMTALAIPLFVAKLRGNEGAVSELDGLTDPQAAKDWRMSPLVFDLAGKGVQTAGRTTVFDLEGRGRTADARWVNDVEAHMGVLVFDVDAGGRRFRDGFEAFRAFLERAAADGVLGRTALSEGRLDAAALAKLGKARGLRMKVGGLNAAPRSLAAAGVTEILLSTAAVERAAGFDGWDDDLSMQPGAVFRRKDGSLGDYMTLWLETRREQQLRGVVGATTDAYLRPAVEPR